MPNSEENKKLARVFLNKSGARFGVGRESFRLQWLKWREAFPDIDLAVE
jgi:hypothetical protein